MRKTILSLLFIAGTALYVITSLLTSGDPPVEARFVRVQRGDVHQVVAINGRIAYSDERLVYAPASAAVERILVKPGQRVSAGEALVRFSAEFPMIAAAFAGRDDTSATLVQEALSMNETVLRSEADSTVRQVLVEPNAPVLAGTPLMRLSSNEQEIVCTAARADAEKVTPGMWAWITSEGEDEGFAEVVEVGVLMADPLTGMTGAEITLRPEQHLELPEGANVAVDVFLAGSDDVLTLPVDAITEQGTVWWVNEGRCTEITVEIVMTDEILAWVELPEGIQVAVGEFHEGQRVVEASP